MKHCLSAFSEYERLSNLFTMVLGAGTAGTVDFLAHLRDIKLKEVTCTSGENQLEILLLYKDLHKQAADPLDADRIKYGSGNLHSLVN
jgi:hypothetical protein